MVSKAYCGIGKVPKNKKRGSMKECAEQGQIRYYGLKKIDKRLAENAAKLKKLKDIAPEKINQKIMKLTIEYATLLGKIRGVKTKIEGEKDKKKKEKLNKEVIKLREKAKKASDILMKHREKEKKNKK